MNYDGFVGPSYESQAVTADQEDLWNWYVEPMESQGATFKSALYPTPGVTEISAAATGPGFGHFYEAGREYAVIGTSFVEIDEFGTQTVRGSVGVCATPATISSNGAGGGQIMVTAATNVYIFDINANTFTQIASMNGKATMGGQLDGYFVVLDASTSTFYISDLLDGTTWDPTQFAQRSIAPDPWKAMKVAGKYIWLLGEQTSEVWYDVGASPFPFVPYPGLLIQYGIIAAFSATVIEGALVWLARTSIGQGEVVRAQGFSPAPISTYPLQYVLNSYGTLSDAVGDTYDDLGHTFYLLSFPTANITWCYDLNTQLWHKRGTWVSENNAFNAWRPRFHAMAFNQHRMLDSSSGSLYKMAVTELTDVEGRAIRRLRKAPCLFQENQRLYFNAFELFMEVGLGTESGQGENPQVMLRYSNDGGQTWQPEIMRSAGKTGEYGTRVRWNRLGMARKRVFEVSVTDPIPWRLTGASVEMRQAPQRLSQAQSLQWGG